VQQAFSSGTNTVQKFGNAFKTALSAPAKKQDYFRNEANEIVTSKNIDTYIPKITQTQAENELKRLQQYDRDVKAGTRSWILKYKENGKKNLWLTSFIQNNDLQRASTEDLMKANKEARKAAIAHNESIKAQTLSAKLGQTAIKGLSMSLNMLAFALISMAVQKFISWIDDTIHRSERLQEAAAQARSAIKDIQSSYDELSSSANNIKDRYAALAQGIDQVSGKNINLNTDEYQEFLDLSNQLSDLFPSLTKNFDENGNAILNLTGNINGIVESIETLIEEEETLTNKQIMEKVPEAYVGLAENLNKYNEDLKQQKDNVDAFDKVATGEKQFIQQKNVSANRTAFLLKLGKDVNKDATDRAREKLIKELNSRNLEYQSDYMITPGDSNGDHYILIDTITAKGTEELKNLPAVSKKVFGDLKKETLLSVRETELLLKHETAEFIPSVRAIVDSIPQFSNTVEDTELEAAKQMLTQDSTWLTAMYDELGDDADETKIKDWVYDNILNPIVSNDKMKLGMADLFNPSSELTPEQMVDIAKTLLEQFQDSKIPINLDFILDEDLKDSAANIDQKLENLVYNTINKKYKLQPGTPFHVLGPDTQENFYEDQDRLNEFINEHQINTQHEIDILEDALEKSQYDLDKAFGKYLREMSWDKNESLEYDPSSFADSLENLEAINQLSEKVTEAAEKGTDVTFQMSEIE